MKYITLLLTILLTISLSYACTVELITTTNENYSVNENILINVTTSNNCENYSLNVYSVDLMNLEEETIYDGKITNNEMEFTTKITEPTVKKIYATTYTNNVTKKLNKTKDTIKYTPIVTTIEFGKMYTIFQSLRGVTDPETYEYGPMDINLRVYNQSGGTRTTTFGFYFLNNDFNITFLTPDYNNCTKLPGYPYSCEFPEKTLLPSQNIYPRVRLTNFKYNDIIFTFGQDGPVLYDLNKPIFAKPFITVKDWNVTNDILDVDFNIYNFNDINFCSLIVNGEEKQRNYNIELDNQFVQDINSGDNTIDINCFTPMNHYTYPSPRYDPIYAQSQPSADNVLITLDSPIFVNRSEFSDGNGSIENPYKLSSCSQLQLLENYSNSNFVLNQDIDCNGFDFEPINNFSGTLNGDGRLVKNLTINKPEQDNVGLFSILDGNVKKIGFDSVLIYGNNNVGGIAGTNNGLIEESYVSGEINGNNYIGGVAGINKRIEINDGFPYNGTTTSKDVLKEILNTYTIVNVNGNTAGGIVGYNYGKILNVYSLGAVNGIITGGLVGVNYTRCYPYNHSIRTGIINNSFSTIETAYDNSCYSTWYYGSGAKETGEITNTIVNSDLRYLRNPTNPPFNRWDFNKVWKQANDDGKKLTSLKNYLVLAWEDKVADFTDFSGGEGTIEDPYQITDCTELSYIYDYPTSNFVIINDIDCTGVSVTPIENFSGILNGNEKTIRNLIINFPQRDNIGLFSTLKGTVTKLILEEVNIIGNNNVGGIAGTNDGNISECYVSGNISGINVVGGIAGTNQRITVINQNGGKTITTPREINNAYSMVNISGETAGGIAGYNYGKIKNTYSTNTNENSGGIVHTNYTNCKDYSHEVESGLIENSFSFIDTAINNSCRSYWYMGSTTIEYGKLINTVFDPNQNYLSDQNQQPFLQWDFNNTWKMIENNRPQYTTTTNYPALSWE